MITPQKIVAWLGGLLGLLLGFFLVGWLAVYLVHNHDKQVIEDSKSATAVQGFDSTNTVLKVRGDSVRVVYVDRYHTYTTVRDSLVKAEPENKPLINLAGRCDRVLFTCAEQHAVDSTRIANDSDEIKKLKAMKAASVPRVSLYALGGYDWMNKAALSQVGIDTRVVGPLSASVFIEAAQGDATERIKSRGVLAMKFTFR